MKNYKDVSLTAKILDTIVCDCCKTILECGSVFHDMDIQEVLSISKIVGYGSIFGDGNLIQLDLCQHCVKKLLGKYIRIEERTI